MPLFASDPIATAFASRSSCPASGSRAWRKRLLKRDFVIEMAARRRDRGDHRSRRLPCLLGLFLHVRRGGFDSLAGGAGGLPGAAGRPRTPECFCVALAAASASSAAFAATASDTFLACSRACVQKERGPTALSSSLAIPPIKQPRPTKRSKSFRCRPFPGESRTAPRGNPRAVRVASRPCSALPLSDYSFACRWPVLLRRALFARLPSLRSSRQGSSRPGTTN